tara:strand:- start:3 stop:167 length:165 start_codon:yes stop_codon:yes gene_type:complete
MASNEFLSTHGSVTGLPEMKMASLEEPLSLEGVGLPGMYSVGKFVKVTSLHATT